MLAGGYCILGERKGPTAVKKLKEGAFDRIELLLGAYEFCGGPKISKTDWGM